MVALADVRRWEPGGVETAFTGFGTAHDRLLDLDADLTASRPPDLLFTLMALWTG